MKTEKEIRKKYDEMLKHTELLMDKVRNPDKYDDVTIENIQEHINGENEQHSMNALIKWVLGDNGKPLVSGSLPLTEGAMKTNVKKAVMGMMAAPPPPPKPYKDVSGRNDA